MTRIQNTVGRWYSSGVLVTSKASILLQHFKASAPESNPLHAAIMCGNKMYAHMELEKAGIRTPKAVAAFSEESAIEILDKIGYPAVIKPTVGSQQVDHSCETKMQQRYNRGQRAHVSLVSSILF